MKRDRTSVLLSDPTLLSTRHPHMQLKITSLQSTLPIYGGRVAYGAEKSRQTLPLAAMGTG